MTKRLWLALGLVLLAANVGAQGIEYRPASGGGSASAIEPGTTTVTGCTSQVLLADGSSKVNCDAGITYDGTNDALVVTTANVAGAAYGSDLVTNGTFTGSATGWTLGAGGGAPDWAYSSNTVTHGNGGGTTALQPSTPLTIVAGQYYMVQYTISGYSAGSLACSIGGTACASASSNGTYRYVALAASTANLLFTPTTTLVATIDTISVRLVTPVPAPLTLTSGATAFTFRATQNTGNLLSGYLSGQFNSAESNAGGEGYWNTGYGGASLNQLSNGIGNSCFGLDSCAQISSGDYNTGHGFRALRLARADSTGNTAHGVNALNTDALINFNTAMGYGAGLSVVGDSNTCYGYQACNGGTYTGSGGFGQDATPTASNQFVFGGNTAGKGFTEAYFGHGVTKASPGSVVLRGTGGSGSNNPAGDIEWAAGLSTGNAKTGQVILSTANPNASGSTAQTKIQREFVGAVLVLANNTTTTAGTFTCASDSVCGTIVEYGVEVNDGASHHQQVEQGIVTCNVSNTNGTFAQGGTSGCTKSSNVQHVSASGGSTLTVTWTMTGANPALLQVNANSGLTPATGFPKVTYTVKNLTNQAVTVP